MPQTISFERYSQNLAHVCAKVSPGTHHVSLIEAISTILPDVPFRYRKTRADWYRIGGLLDADRKKVAASLREWAEDESDHDIFALYGKFGAADYVTTRFDGKTHYFVAPDGPNAADFIQLQVEELVEVVDRPLFVNGEVPDDIEELLDPNGAYRARLAPDEVTPAVYDFRSIIDISALVADQLSSEGSDLRYIRFLEEWDKSTAASKHRFCDHFVLQTLPFMDRFGERKIEAMPLPVKPFALPEDAVLSYSGSALCNFLHDYDRKAGFPMAWYFAMLIDKKNWPQIATTVYQDHQRYYRYLPEKDLAVLEHWIHYPYSF